MNEAVAAEGAFAGEADVFHGFLRTKIFAAGDEFDAFGSKVFKCGPDHCEFDDWVKVCASIWGCHPGVTDFEVAIFMADVVIA